MTRSLCIPTLLLALSPLTAQWKTGAQAPLHARDPLTVDSGYIDNNTNKEPRRLHEDTAVRPEHDLGEADVSRSHESPDGLVCCG